jgi:hypothetical protein
MNKAKAYRDYIARWKRVNEFQAEEYRRMSPATRGRQFFSLLEMARSMNWQTSTPAEIEEVRSRWRRLREAYLGKGRT